MSSLYILDINPFIGYLTCKYLLSLGKSSFHCVDGFLCCAERKERRKKMKEEGLEGNIKILIVCLVLFLLFALIAFLLFK